MKDLATGQHQNMDTQPSATAAAATNAEEYESTHVHAVYEKIAPHFSSTRHSPWPRVAAFLEAQRPGSIGLDVGCGNGKYLDVNPTLHIFGSDRSNELVRLARNRGTSTNSRRGTDTNAAAKPQEAGQGGAGGGTEVAVADGLALPYRLDAFDFVICIAVVHHLSTRERRVEAIGELLSRLRPSSQCSSSKPAALVFVWALEQKSSRRGWDESSDQDTLVPWVMRAKGQPNETFQRYYHLYKEGELEEDVITAGGVIEESGYERDNWWVIFSRPWS